jgi:hypothetical protein
MSTLSKTESIQIKKTNEKQPTASKYPIFGNGIRRLEDVKLFETLDRTRLVRSEFLFGCAVMKLVSRLSCTKEGSS